MSYYGQRMGDYSTGGYGSMGDPGLLSFIGKLVKPIWKVAKPVIGAALGIPMIPAVVGGVAGAVAGKSMVPYAAPPPPPRLVGSPPPPARLPVERLPDTEVRLQASPAGFARPAIIPPRMARVAA